MSRFGEVSVAREPLEGGGFVLRSTRELLPAPRSVSAVLARWAADAPERPFLVERGERGAWISSSYRETLDSVQSLGQALLDLGLGPRTPLMLLSGNGIDHAHLALAAMHVGIPAAPISTAFSLATRDATRLVRLYESLRPGALFASDASFAPAVSALPREVPLIASRDEAAFGRRDVLLVSRERERRATSAVAGAAARIGPDSVAKVLFTSGSTGWPKGVVNTQRMLCSNQTAIAMNWPFLAAHPPRVVDWLPWSHTFGGNHNFFMVLWHGGTLWIDAGKPAPGAFDDTLANLREISPTAYFNVPRGYDLLADALERDDELARRFFRDLELVFYAASALPQSTWERLERLSRRARGEVVPMVSAWGSTETAPMVTQVHYPIARAGVIGVPIPGCELAFVPSQERLEMRVKGPNVSPGYWRPGGEIEPLPRDSRGFYAMGDAGRLVDEAAPEKGVLFDGRTAENFKLSSGTWVRVGELRVALVAACAPLAQDFVIAGHDRDHVGVLVFPHSSATAITELESRLRERLTLFNRSAGGSSSIVRRALVLRAPPSLDAGEITDKGYVNQRAVLSRRAEEVERLFGDGEGLIHLT